MKVLTMRQQALSLAILEDKRVLAVTTINIKKNHSITSCLPLIFDGQFGLDTQELDRIVVAEGPGSYTGLQLH